MTDYKFADRISSMKDTALYMRSFFDNMNDPEMRSFGGGAPGRSVLPMKYMSEIAGELFSEEGRGIEAFQYSATFGLDDLRQAVCDHLLIPTGVQAEPENIQIVSGGMETIYLVSQLFLQPGSIVLTEDPTFVHAVETFQMFEAEIVPCECDDDGIIPEDVEKKIKEYDPKLIYVTPTFANPTGRSLPVERRKALAELASKYNVMILEDDPYRDVRYDGEPLQAIRSFDKTGNVIMACSFSKIFAPGSRLGYSVADPDLIYMIRDVKIATNSQPPGISEVLLAEYFRRGFFEENLRLICDTYKAGRDAMMETMDEYFPKEIKRTTPDGGFFIWVEFPEGFSASELKRRAEEKKYTFLTGGKWFANSDPSEHDNTARFNFTSQTPATIREGMKVIGEMACEMMGK